MKTRLVLLITSILLTPQLSHSAGHGGISCADILARSKVKTKGKNAKTGKAECVMIEHTAGIGRGTMDSVYECKCIKYELHTREDYTCTVEVKKK